MGSSLLERSTRVGEIRKEGKNRKARKKGRRQEGRRHGKERIIAVYKSFLGGQNKQNGGEMSMEELRGRQDDI